jgi:hypothetical protein
MHPVLFRAIMAMGCNWVITRGGFTAEDSAYVLRSRVAEEAGYALVRGGEEQ